MSHIFDALQRSELERDSSEHAIPVASTELLERAERQMAARWRLETETDGLSESDLPEVNLPFELRVAPAGAQTKETSAEATRAAEQSKFFSKVQTLEIAPVRQDRLACFTDKNSPAAEAFRLLGVRLRHIRKSRQLRTILITSTVPREGKSFSAANLACTLASSTDQKTLLLEGDLRRPTLSESFGLPAKPGIAECVLDDGNLSANVYRLEALNLWILPAGIRHSNPLDVIQSTKLPTLMDQLNSWFDWIIIDSPPMLPLADTSAWARLADGILLVTRQGVTEKRKLQRGLEAIEPDKLIGALLNSSSGSPEEDYYYYRTEATEMKAADTSVE